MTSSIVANARSGTNSLSGQGGNLRDTATGGTMRGGVTTAGAGTAAGWAPATRVGVGEAGTPEPGLVAGRSTFSAASRPKPSASTLISPSDAPRSTTSMVS